MLTFGTVFENQGFGDSSSENQLAVAEPTSFARLCISQSCENISYRISASVPMESFIYLGNGLQPQDNFGQVLPMAPRCLHPISQLQFHLPRHYTSIRQDL